MEEPVKQQESEIMQRSLVGLRKQLSLQTRGGRTKQHVRKACATGSGACVELALASAPNLKMLYYIFFNFNKF